ncbi:MAG: efflux transporter outer membrane subunit [Alphaproteobacteria bacterium]|nr:efflux transporter outer membrane subunit [Alphaproteobacteria bacterium]
MSERRRDRAPDRSMQTAAAVLVFVTGCAVGPDPSRPAIAVPDTFVRAGAAEGSLAYEDWLSALGDPVLSELVARGVAGNLELAQADARVQTARANARLSKAALLPSGTGRSSFQRQRISEATAGLGALAGAGGGSGTPGIENPADVYDAAFDASWELDFFGANRRALGAARSDYQAALADFTAARLRIGADIARAYAEYRQAETLLALNASALSAQRELLRLTEVKARLGDVTQLDVDQTRARLAALEAERPGFEINRIVALNQLAVLTGSAPGSVDALLATPSLARIPSGLAMDDPAALLRRRPDILAAEYRAAAATNRVGVEIAEYFPKIQIAGSIGTQAATSGDLLTGAAQTFSYGPSLSWRVLDFARIESAIAAARGREAEALAAYKLTVLTALEDVETQAARFSGLSEERQKRRESVAIQARVLETISAQYRAGSVDYLAVLDAERTLRAEEQSAARAEANLLIAYASLAKALGGIESQAGESDALTLTGASIAER